MTEHRKPDTTAPWTDEQVAALNDHQRHGGMHGFTCGTHSSALLEARNDGWHCVVEGCSWHQTWCHYFQLLGVNR